jgi:hypothetical protein
MHVCSALEDLVVVYFGSAAFKILRLTFIAMVSVHLFACMYFRVKVIGSDHPEQVKYFYNSRNIDEDVSTFFP